MATRSDVDGERSFGIEAQLLHRLLRALGLHAAIDYVESIGLAAIHAHETALVTATREALSGINSVRLYGPADSAGIVSFTIEGVHPHDIGTILDTEGIAVRTGQHCAQPVMDRYGIAATVRASVAIYNTRAEIDALVDGMHKVREVFG